MPDHALSTLITITFVAATVNGALGHGFSSITVPVALIFYTGRVLNPALVLVEIAINLYVLLANRTAVPAIWPRIRIMILGLIPGIIVGSYLLSLVNPVWLKLGVFAALLPLILLQAAGVRRPLHAERAVGVPFGAGLGVLYSLTTISGPPLALMFNNQGLVKHEFRAALGVIRVAESTFTAILYYWLGFYTTESTSLILPILPSVLIGIPIGAILIARVNPETFRRLCMTFDSWIVAYALSRILAEIGLVPTPYAYTVLAGAASIDSILLYVFFIRLQQLDAVGRRIPSATSRMGRHRRARRRVSVEKSAPG